MRKSSQINAENRGQALRPLEERVLVCVSDSDRDAAVAFLDGAIRWPIQQVGLAEAREEIGRGAGVLVISEELLGPDNIRALQEDLGKEPEWSYLPLVILAEQDRVEPVLAALGEEVGALMVAKPPREIELVHAVQASVRHRQRQYQVRDLLRQYNDLLTSIRDSFVLFDQDWRFIYANDKVVESRGRPLEELLGKRKWDLFPEIVGSDYHRALMKAAETRTPQSLEFFEPRANRWYQYRIYPSDAGVSVFGTDITERKANEEALRESEERLRLMMESAREYAIFSLDLEGRITSWNSGAERLLGYTEEEALGRHFRKIFTEQDKASGQAESELRHALDVGRAEDERWHVRKNGSRFWAGGQTTPITDDAGNVRGFLKILRDYTGRKRAEVWLRSLNETLEKRVAERTEEAERRAVQLQRLASELTNAEQQERRRLAQVLHDHLQQILVAAKMQVGMLSRRPPDDAIGESLARVDNLLQRSIDASRSLTVELSPPILYDAGLAPALHWLSRNMLETHGLQVEVDADEEADPESDNAKAFLFQAVRELLFNVVKHANISSASVSLRRAGPDVEVVVSDEGEGFKSSGSTEKAGGFGLFSMRERVEWLGGSLKIETGAGAGTKISLRVPMTLPTERSGRAVAEEDPQAEMENVEPAEADIIGERCGKRIRILLADDHKILREGLAGLLREQSDFDVVSEASDGQMALEMARQTRPDVIVMDVSMPRLNGAEATRKITAEMPDIAIVGLSMHSQEDMAKAMHLAGAVAYVTKGAPSEMLTAAIRDAFNKKNS